MMSVAVRTQIIVLDILTSIIDSVAASWKEQGILPQEVEGKLNLLEVARERCFRSVVPTGQLALAPKQYKVYAKKLLAITEIIKRKWPERIPAIAFLNTGLAMVEDVRFAHRKTTDNASRLRKERWLTLVERLMDVYGLYDPDLEAIAEMDEGAALADEIIEELRR